MTARLEVASKISDTRAAVRKKKLETSYDITNLWLADVYTIDRKFTRAQLAKVASQLTNPLTEQAFIYPKLPKFPPHYRRRVQFSWAVEIGFLPGVTDNVGNTVRETIEDLFAIKFKTIEGVYSSQVTFVTGNLNKKDAQAIAGELHNPLIQRAHIKDWQTWKKDGGMDVIVPKVVLHERPEADTISLDVSDRELERIGRDGIKNRDGTSRGPLALSLAYMKAIQKYFKTLGRSPTDVELESLAQTWSEHCKHTIFADPLDELKDGLFRTYIKGATDKIRKDRKRDICVSVFADNSGGIVFDKDWVVSDKVETHNSPSALDPYGGALTGIVGVNRDTIGFGLGAKPVINKYGYCFAPPWDKTRLFRGSRRGNEMLSARRIMDGVIEGVNVGGNSSGIPTTQGFLFFDSRFRGKPLVFVGTVGLIPRKVKGRPAHEKAARAGDYIVMVGGRVGLDGIHGATFSSEELTTGSPVSAVQIGDPITQKKLSDAIVKEARDRGLFNSITDNGAGGLSSSVGEMAKQSGGCHVLLEKVPLKYPGMAPWQIWISESQERMTLAVPKKNWKKFSRLVQRRGVEATIIGEFTSSGKCIVEWHGKKIVDLDIQFFHYGLPPRPMKSRYTKPKHKEPKLQKLPNLTKIFLEMLTRPNIAGFQFISEQYDHTVQGGSVLRPLQGRGQVNGDSTVVKPVLNSNRGVVLSQGIYPTYSDIDTYHMAACALDTAVRNVVAAGASLEHLALLDNFCWASSDEPEQLGRLKRAAKACYDYATAYGTPFISGKDSMFNDFAGYDAEGKPVKISIPPTLLISAIAVVEDIARVVSPDSKSAQDLVYVLGETYEELGASEYYALWGDKQSLTSYKKKSLYIGNKVPQVKAKKNKKLYQALSLCIAQGLVASAQSVNRGGLAVAIAKTAMGGMLGLEVSLANLPGKTSRDDFALFSESQGRVLVTVAPQNRTRFERLMQGNHFALLGRVTDNGYIHIRGRDGKALIKTSIENALNSYKLTFKNY